MDVTPLGCEAPIKVNLRVICASHRNLRAMMGRGEFREDLYYRLSGICMELPPLTSRADKEALIYKCIAHESTGSRPVSIEASALAKLLAYDWPGNIRELRNTIRTAIAICDNGLIRITDLPVDIRHYVPAETSAGEHVSLDAAERQALLQVIEQHHWNMTLVAGHLKISRNTLYRKIKYHAIPILRARPHHA
jgi:sigma-54 dependent transcriptional regulator, acetoin dehydrogenase operon transcriptional activator AcoR